MDSWTWNLHGNTKRSVEFGAEQSVCDCLVYYFFICLFGFITPETLFFLCVCVCDKRNCQVSVFVVDTN